MTKENGQTQYYAKISRQINDRFRRIRYNTTARMHRGDGMATFEDFCNYLIRLGSAYVDDHWRQYSTVCDPCHHNYDVIMKFDTFNDDFRYLKDFLNISRQHLPDFFPPGDTRTNSDVTELFMLTLPLILRVKLYEMYEKDFLLFGYERPWYCYRD